MLTPALEQEVLGTLRRYTSEFTARGIVHRAHARASDRTNSPRSFADVVLYGARLFVPEPERAKLVDELSRLFGEPRGTRRSLRMSVSDESSARRARVMVRGMAAEAGASRLLGLHAATALSELARNIILYAGHGELEIDMLESPTRIRIVATDRGPGIPNLEEVMSGEYVSRTGMGRGLRGTRRLADRFDVRTGPGGTRVEVELLL